MYVKAARRMLVKLNPLLTKEEEKEIELNEKIRKSSSIKMVTIVLEPIL
jgi:hypothetical protein